MLLYFIEPPLLRNLRPRDNLDSRTERVASGSLSLAIRYKSPTSAAGVNSPVNAESVLELDRARHRANARPVPESKGIQPALQVSNAIAGNVVAWKQFSRR